MFELIGCVVPQKIRGEPTLLLDIAHSWIFQRYEVMMRTIQD